MKDSNYIKEKAKLREIPAKIVWIFYAILCLLLALKFFLFLEKVNQDFDRDVLFVSRWVFLLSLTGIISLWFLRLGSLSKEERIFSTFRKISENSFRHQLAYVLFLLSLGFLFIFSIFFQKSLLFYILSFVSLTIGMASMIAGFWNWKKYWKSIGNKNKQTNILFNIF